MIDIAKVAKYFNDELQTLAGYESVTITVGAPLHNANSNPPYCALYLLKKRCAIDTSFLAKYDVHLEGGLEQEKGMDTSVLTNFFENSIRRDRTLRGAGTHTNAIEIEFLNISESGRPMIFFRMLIEISVREKVLQ